MQQVTLVWLRRDLRLDDNAALYRALAKEKNVLPLFIFDTEILNKLPNKYDRRVDFIHAALENIQNQLHEIGSNLLVKIGSPQEVYKQLIKDYQISSVYTNHDYEPYAIDRDKKIEHFLKSHNISFHTFKDQCIFEKSEVTKDDGLPYTIFTPYSKKWKAKLNEFYLKSYPCKKYYANFLKTTSSKIPSLKDLGFIKTDIDFKPFVLNKKIVESYHNTRDIPSIAGTTRASIHLRFGTISVRKLATYAKQFNEVYLNELIWRDFYMMILHHYPHIIDTSFKKQYDKIPWRNNEIEFKAWCEGKTGYPIVDAGMRELNNTGFMHNRVRMIVASFLTKHLLIDWRWGEAYFAEKLNDFDLSANNGGWQWAASSGCDAAPYFRVFNPSEQTKRFDANHIYIKKWVPEFQDLNYPQPIVDHKFARERVLKVYKEALSEQ